RQRQCPRHGTVADRPAGASARRAAAGSAGRNPDPAGGDARRDPRRQLLAPRAPARRPLRPGLAHLRLRRAPADLPRRCRAGLPGHDRLPAGRGRRRGRALEQREQHALGPAADGAGPRPGPAGPRLADATGATAPPPLTRPRRTPGRAANETPERTNAGTGPASNQVPLESLPPRLGNTGREPIPTWLSAPDYRAGATGAAGIMGAGFLAAGFRAALFLEAFLAGFLAAFFLAAFLAGLRAAFLAVFLVAFLATFFFAAFLAGLRAAFLAVFLVAFLATFFFATFFFAAF